MTSAQAALFRTVPEKDYLVFWTAAQVGRSVVRTDSWWGLGGWLSQCPGAWVRNARSPACVRNRIGSSRRLIDGAGGYAGTDVGAAADGTVDEVAKAPRASLNATCVVRTMCAQTHLLAP